MTGKRWTEVHIEFERPYKFGDAFWVSFDFSDDLDRLYKAFDECRDEVYQAVDDIREDWADDNLADEKDLAPVYPVKMKTELMFINVHVWPLDRKETAKEDLSKGNSWDISLQGDATIRVRGQAPVEDVEHDIAQALKTCCGIVNWWVVD